jgi:uncharacterized double-CXXCG motif protein
LKLTKPRIVPRRRIVPTLRLRSLTLALGRDHSSLHPKLNAAVFYRLTLDQRDWFKYQIEGDHQHRIPFFMCDGCGGPTAFVGEAYPGVDVTRSARLAEMVGRGTVRQPELDELRALLRDQCPPSAVLTPRAGLGPFQGTLRGCPLDLAWHEPWTVFFRTESVGALRARGVALPPVVPAALTPKPSKKRGTSGARAIDAPDVPPLYEPQVGCGVALTAESFDPPERPPCQVCGGARQRIRDRMVVDAASYDAACGDIMRVRNAVNRIVVTERFVEAARDAGLTGFVAVPLDSA